ncbi:MAG: CoA ester lyase [Candidatus Izemoplasmatales bacterium]
MIRSLLFIPGNQPNLIQNAFLFESDAIIFDLEDAVHVDEKDNARMLVHQFVNMQKTQSETKIFVRINSMDTPFFQADFDLLSKDPIDAFVYPKATIEDVTLLSDMISKLNKQLSILPIVEDATGILSANGIAKIPHVIGLFLGGEDLARDLEVKRTKESLELLYARQHIIMVCAANKILSVDTPFTDVFDDSSFQKDVLYAKSLGMKAKSAIHPRHIDFINQSFSPSKADIEYSFKVMKALEVATKEKKGAFSVDGKMVDKPVIDRAKNTIEVARKLHLVNQNEE